MNGNSGNDLTFRLFRMVKKQNHAYGRFLGLSVNEKGRQGRRRCLPLLNAEHYFSSILSMFVDDAQS